MSLLPRNFGHFFSPFCALSRRRRAQGTDDDFVKGHLGGEDVSVEVRLRAHHGVAESDGRSQKIAARTLDVSRPPVALVVGLPGPNRDAEKTASFDVVNWFSERKLGGRLSGAAVLSYQPQFKQGASGGNPDISQVMGLNKTPAYARERLGSSKNLATRLFQTSESTTWPWPANSMPVDLFSRSRASSTLSDTFVNS